MVSKRYDYIDYIKVFACFLVLLGHLLMSLRTIVDNDYVEYVIYFVYLFHMPLFMSVSGFLYANNKLNLNVKSILSFSKKKIINLLVPYIFFYNIFMLLSIIASSSVNTPKGISEWLGIFNNPIAPYWYLYALLSLFIFIPWLEKIIKKDKYVFLILFILKIITFHIKIPLYFIKSIMTFGVYFYIGKLLYNYKFNKKKNISIMIFVIIYIGLSAIAYHYKGMISSTYENYINLMFGITGVLIFYLLFYNTKKIELFDKYKNYTFEIYLTHTIFAACMRIIMLKVGITNYFIHFFIGIIASIYLPIIMSNVSKKIKYTEFFFYPIKTIKELKQER